MNPKTGEITGISPTGVVLDELGQVREGFEQLPDGLQKLATLKMRRAAELANALAYANPTAPVPLPKVNQRSSTPLAKWAKKKRLAKISAKSRRLNRR